MQYVENMFASYCLFFITEAAGEICMLCRFQKLFCDSFCTYLSSHFKVSETSYILSIMVYPKRRKKLFNLFWHCRLI